VFDLKEDLFPENSLVGNQRVQSGVRRQPKSTWKQKYLFFSLRKSLKEHISRNIVIFNKYFQNESFIMI
jgi:hypothetical protein